LAVLFQLSSAGCRQFVIFGVTVIFGRSPFRLELSILLKAVKRREERARIHLECVAAKGPQVLRDSVTVQGLAAENRQDHQFQRALWDVQLIHWFSFSAPR